MERRFTGELVNFKSPEHRNFEKKRLKAYIKGEEYFSFHKDKYGFPIFYRTDTGQLNFEATV